MINIEYITDKEKTLLTIIFNKKVLNHLKAKCDDYLHLFQSSYDANRITILKADTGYRIIRVPNLYKHYQVIVKHRLLHIKEFSIKKCIYFVKKNGMIKIHI